MSKNILGSCKSYDTHAIVSIIGFVLPVGYSTEKSIIIIDTKQFALIYSVYRFSAKMRTTRGK